MLHRATYCNWLDFGETMPGEFDQYEDRSPGALERITREH